MNIRLTDNYRISSDKYNYILIKEDGDRVIHEGYFTTLDSLVKHFINLKIRGFNANSIHTLLISIKSLSDCLNKALHTFKSEDVVSNTTQIDRNMEVKNNG